MTGAPPEPLQLVFDGIKAGVRAGGAVAWLPASMWAPARELQRRMDAMNAEVDRVQKLIDAAQAEADAAGGVQTPWYGP